MSFCRIGVLREDLRLICRCFLVLVRYLVLLLLIWGWWGSNVLYHVQTVDWVKREQVSTNTERYSLSALLPKSSPIQKPHHLVYSNARLPFKFSPSHHHSRRTRTPTRNRPPNRTRSLHGLPQTRTSLRNRLPNQRLHRLSPHCLLRSMPHHHSPRRHSHAPHGIGCIVRCHGGTV